MITKEDIYARLISNCLYLTVNLNDTFAYACSDSETMDADDIEELIGLYEEFGVWLVNVAYCSLKRWLEDNIRENVVPYPTSDQLQKPIKISKEDSIKFTQIADKLIDIAKEGAIIHYMYWLKLQKEKQNV